ncbi:hypothetical protein FACS1894160_1830 [Bacteroidia bacterium]|nr:hypothetical protein FACS1894160_1830 [Bacteroidia bacterium]
MKTFRNLLLIFFIATIGYSCNNSDEQNGLNDIDLVGTKWKLTSFVVNETPKMPEPASENCYWVSFNNDNTLTGKSSSNAIAGYQEINRKLSHIQINAGFATEAMERSPDGELFLKNLNSSYRYTTTKNTLKLYHTEKNYLLFKKIEDENLYADNIIGRWKLTEMTTIYNYDNQNVNIINYSNDNIVYDFHADKKLIVTGLIPDDLSEGEHYYQYQIPNVCPTCLPGPNLIIGDNDRIYCFIKENEMTINAEKIVGQVVDETGLIVEQGESVRKSKTFVKLN